MLREHHCTVCCTVGSNKYGRHTAWHDVCHHVDWRRACVAQDGNALTLSVCTYTWLTWKVLSSCAAPWDTHLWLHPWQHSAVPMVVGAGLFGRHCHGRPGLLQRRSVPCCGWQDPRQDLAVDKWGHCSHMETLYIDFFFFKFLSFSFPHARTALFHCTNGITTASFPFQRPRTVHYFKCHAPSSPALPCSRASRPLILKRRGVRDR